MNVLISQWCVFFIFFIFVSVDTISSRNNASILNFNILFDWKVNIVGALRRSTFKIPSHFQKRQKKNKRKIKKKRVFLLKIDFGFWCNFKTNYRRYMKFSLVVYISIFYTWYNFQNILICFELFRNIFSFPFY